MRGLKLKGGVLSPWAAGAEIVVACAPQRVLHFYYCHYSCKQAGAESWRLLEKLEDFSHECFVRGSPRHTPYLVSIKKDSYVDLARVCEPQSWIEFTVG